jgi:hypothetical protein
MLPAVVARLAGAAASSAAAAAAAALPCGRLTAQLVSASGGNPQAASPSGRPQQPARGIATTSSCGSSGGPPGDKQPQQQPPLSKAFVAGKLSQEELWLAGLPGKLKVWSVRTHPELKVGVGEGRGVTCSVNVGGAGCAC